MTARHTLLIALLYLPLSAMNLKKMSNEAFEHELEQFRERLAAHYKDANLATRISLNPQATLSVTKALRRIAKQHGIILPKHHEQKPQRSASEPMANTKEVQPEPTRTLTPPIRPQSPAKAALLSYKALLFGQSDLLDELAIKESTPVISVRDEENNLCFAYRDCEKNYLLFEQMLGEKDFIAWHGKDARTPEVKKVSENLLIISRPYWHRISDLYVFIQPGGTRRVFRGLIAIFDTNERQEFKAKAQTIRELLVARIKDATSGGFLNQATDAISRP